MALWSLGRKNTGPAAEDSQAVIKDFEQQIAAQDELMYGAALFFEAVSLFHEDQAAVLETLRKQFRNWIQSGRDASQRAQALLEQVRQDPSKAGLIRQFSFSPFQGHPNPAEMQQRAQAFVETYNRIFPGRSRSQEFTRDETFRLIEETAKLMPGAAPATSPGRS